MIRFVPASSRGQADYGRLKTAYSFSFANRYEPTRMGFGALRVLNDDTIAGGNGFPEHPHDNMEIITIVLDGALEHRDSMGSGGVIRAGDIQVMSAGDGIHHSEFNASATEPVSLFQLWIQPNQHNIIPRYDQKSFARHEKKNLWTTIVSSDARAGSMMIYQDAFITLGTRDSAATYTPHIAGNGVFAMCISGAGTIGDYTLAARDAVEITAMQHINILPQGESSFLLVEVPMK